MTSRRAEFRTSLQGRRRQVWNAMKPDRRRPCLGTSTRHYFLNDRLNTLSITVSLLNAKMSSFGRLFAEDGRFRAISLLVSYRYGTPSLKLPSREENLSKRALWTEKNNSRHFRSFSPISGLLRTLLRLRAVNGGDRGFMVEEGYTRCRGEIVRANLRQFFSDVKGERANIRRKDPKCLSTSV